MALLPEGAWQKLRIGQWFKAMLIDKETFQMFEKAWEAQDEQAFALSLEAVWQAAYKNIALPRVKDAQRAREWTWDALTRCHQLAMSKQLTAAAFMERFELTLRGWKRPGKRPAPGLIKKRLADEARERRRAVGDVYFDYLSTSDEPREFLGDEIVAMRQSLVHVPDAVKRATLAAIFCYLEKHGGDGDLGYRPKQWVVAAPFMAIARARLSLKRCGAVANRLLHPQVYEYMEGCGLSVFRDLEVSPQNLRDKIIQLRGRVEEMAADRSGRETIQVLIAWYEGKLAETDGVAVVLPAPLTQKRSGFRLNKDVSRYLEKAMGVSQNTARKRFDRVKSYFGELTRKIRE